MHNFQDIVTKQRTFFYQNVPFSLEFRKKALIKLKNALENNQEAFIKAIYDDFQKSEFETILTEFAMLKLEIKNYLKNLNKWSKSQAVSSSILNFPSEDHILKQPFGVVLIISPWNYPLLLAIQPIISAIAAGNCVILKPSEISANTSAVLRNMLNSIFDAEFVTVVEGDVEVTTRLLEQKFDKIFFTGSTQVGKIIQRKAADNLTPTVLELGGKSPCVISSSANLDIAAKRIVFGKFVNAGQTCIAPDFIWIHESIKDKFIEILKNTIFSFYGNDIENNKDYPRIINKKQFERLKSYLTKGRIIFGGSYNKDTCYLSPTILDEIQFSDAVMKEEIFGPILPVLTFNNLEEVVLHNHQNEKPLAMYLFSTNKKEIDTFMTRTQFGGGCVNDVLSHIVNDKVPFGGFGSSGTGNYHGKFGFDAFTHQKTLVRRKNWLDIPLKYPPYDKKGTWISKIISKF